MALRGQRRGVDRLGLGDGLLGGIQVSLRDVHPRQLAVGLDFVGEPGDEALQFLLGLIGLAGPGQEGRQEVPRVLVVGGRVPGRLVLLQGLFRAVQELQDHAHLAMEDRQVDARLQGRLVDLQGVGVLVGRIRRSALRQ